MNLKILNQLIIVLERVKGDTQSKIALGILSAGVIILGSAQFNLLAFSKSNAGDEKIISASTGDSELYVQIIGMALILIGVFLAIHRYYTLNKASDTKNIALFFMPGFDNINDNLPIYALPSNEQKKIKEVKFKKISSYSVDEIIKEYSFYARMVNDRLEHNDVEKAYLVALGSVPFLYLMGTLFRNGHLPIRVLEHERSSDKWHLLDDIGSGESLQYGCSQTIGEEALSTVKANSKNEIAFSISFTNKILESELPIEFNSHTLNVKLASGYRFDAIPTEPVQDEIVKEIAHTITVLAKKADKVHLFICAQASIVLKLGKLYQDNMSGRVVIHNYDSGSHKYNWAIEFYQGNITSSSNPYRDMISPPDL